MFNVQRMALPRVSRRMLLVGGIVLTAAPLLASTKVFAGPKVSQACVGFRDSPRGDHRCGTCHLFRPPSACLDVAGTITENCSCKIWLPEIG